MRMNNSNIILWAYENGKFYVAELFRA